MGHYQAVLGLLKTLGFIRIDVIPSGLPPLKKGAQAPPPVRKEMLQILFGNHSQKIKLDFSEIHKNKISYTTQVLGRYLKKHRSENLVFVAGADQLPLWKKWRDFKKLTASCHWIFLSRKGLPQKTIENPIAELQKKRILGKELFSHSDSNPSPIRIWPLFQSQNSQRLYLLVLHTPAPAISSSEIRKKIKDPRQKCPVGFPLDLWRYLKKNHIYVSSSRK